MRCRQEIISSRVSYPAPRAACQIRAFAATFRAAPATRALSPRAGGFFASSKIRM